MHGLFSCHSIAGITCAGVIGCSRFLLAQEPSEQNEHSEPAQQARSLHLSRPLLLLGLIAFSVLLSVGVLFDWSALYLTGTLHTSAGVAAACFSTFLVCMTLGRTVGDHLLARMGTTQKRCSREIGII